MPSINLPSLNIPEEGLKEKETMENILDTLQKYRKELNFLLMNLDLDNMPTIGGLLGDIEGDYSLISQTVDGILLSVGNISGDVSALELRADSISATVANNTGDIASLVITAQGIQSTVASLDEEVGGFYSQITQLDNEISSIVSFTDVTGNQIASKINQTATTISLNASKIDLTGITTLYDATNLGYYVQSRGRGLTFYENGYAYLKITYRDPSTARIYSDSSLYIGDTNKLTYFEGSVNFTNATVLGLNTDGIMKWA